MVRGVRKSCILSHVQVNSWSLGRAVVAVIEVLREERKMVRCSIGSSLLQGTLLPSFSSSGLRG